MEQPKIHVLAIISLVCGIVGLILAAIGFCCCYGCLEVPFSLGAFITGFMAINQIGADPETHSGKGLAIGGIVAAIIAVIVNIVWVVIAVAFTGLSAAMG